MPVFRVEKNRNYTTMSNYHLQDPTLSLKAKGLLSQILSYPDDWEYNIRGLTNHCKEGRSGVSAALSELEAHGYVVRHRLRDATGRLRTMEYVIYEKPNPPESENPAQVNPVQELSAQEIPIQGMPAQENQPLQSTKLINTKLQSTKTTKSAGLGTYQNVILSEEELLKLKEAYPGDYEEKINRLSEYMASSGRKYKSHYLTILNWAREDEAKRRETKKAGTALYYPDYSCEEGTSL